MTRQEEAAFDKKAEAHFRSHRGTPKGYDSRVLRKGGYRNSAERKERKKLHDKNFDTIFPKAPGAGF